MKAGTGNSRTDRHSLNTEIADWILFSRDKTGSGKNPEKFGESGIEIG